MITDCAIFRDGKCIKDGLALDELEGVEGGGDFVWIDIQYEGESDANSLAEAIDLPDFSMKQMQEDHPRARLHDLDGDYFIIMRFAEYDDQREAVDFHEIQVMTGADYAVTVRHDDAGDPSAIRKLLDEKSSLTSLGPAGVIWAVTEHVIAGYEPIIESLDLDIDQVEEQVFKHEGAELTRRMFALRSTISDFYRAVHSLQGPVEVVESGVHENLDEGQKFFRDLRDRLRLMEEELIAQRDQLASAFDANMALVSKEQNEIVQTISSWAAIIAVPTLLSGIYGMNFKHMPGIESQYGLALALAFLVSVGFGLFLMFKRARWL